MADLEQWVNIERADKWVEDDVKSVERLGPLHFECKFKKAKLAGFKVQVEPVGTQATYTTAEQGRNQQFCLRHGAGARSNSGKKKYKLEQDVYLPAAGGNRFKIKAKYRKKIVEASKTVVTRRRLFYQSCVMDGITAGSVADMEKDYWAPNEYYLKLLKKADGTMAFTKTLFRDSGSGADNYVDFIKNAKSAWALQDRMPYAFMLVWVNYIAAMADKEVTQIVKADLPSKAWTWSWSGLSFEFEVGAWLWHGLIDADDTAQRWLVSIDTWFREGTTGAWVRVAIPKSQVTLAGDKRFEFGGYHKVKVDLSPEDLAGVRNRFTERKGQLGFRMKFRVTGGWTNGFSFNGVNMITVAAKALWKTQTDAVKAYTLNHELGHKIGMVATGTGRCPDPPPKLYGEVTSGPSANNKGHQGPHCEEGASYDASKSKWSGTPGCVMFGADGTTDGSAPPTYCASCKPIVRKLDLSAGMPGFASTPNDF